MPAVPDDYEARVRSLLPAKALAVAAYGESVAAYRYLTLSQKTASASLRQVFLETAAEERVHHAQVQDLQRRHFPESDFVLSSDDKELIIVGPRLLEVTDCPSVRRALDLIIKSERLTGRFYATLYETVSDANLKALVKEMAEECFRHARRLEGLSLDDA